MLSTRLSPSYISIQLENLDQPHALNNFEMHTDNSSQVSELGSSANRAEEPYYGTRSQLFSGTSTEYLNQDTHFDPTFAEDPILLNPTLFLYDPRIRKNISQFFKQYPLALPQWLWEADSQADDCFNCRKDFGLFNRRHHCRRCGNIFCNPCSSSRIPLTEAIQNNKVSEINHPTQSLNLAKKQELSLWTQKQSTVLLRACDVCFSISRENANISPTSTQLPLNFCMEMTTDGPKMNELKDEVNDDIDEKLSFHDSCPACHINLNSISSIESEHEEHISNCLREGFIGNGFGNHVLEGNLAPYLAFSLSERDHINGQECQICLDTFRSGDKVVRLKCFCCYHQLCAKDWFQQSPSCPTHGL